MQQLFFSGLELQCTKHLTYFCLIDKGKPTFPGSTYNVFMTRNQSLQFSRATTSHRVYRRARKIIFM